LRLAKEFHHLIPSQLGFTDDMTLGEGGEGDLAQLQADVVKCEAAVGEAEILLKSSNSVLLNLQTERVGTLLTTEILHIPSMTGLVMMDHHGDDDGPEENTAFVSTGSVVVLVRFLLHRNTTRTFHDQMTTPLNMKIIFQLSRSSFTVEDLSNSRWIG
jgi:hypothetical protein